MRRCNLSLYRLLLVAAAVSLAATPLGAQTSPWLDREQPRAVWADLMYPSFDDAEGYSVLLFTVGGRLPISKSARLVVEVPLANSSSDFGEDGFLAGNPLIGVEAGALTQGMRGGVGVRVPLVGSDAPGATVEGGILGDWERLESYLTKVVAIQADGAYRRRQENGLIGEFGIMPVALIPTDDVESDLEDTEFLINYRAGVGFDGGKFEGMLTLSGRWLVSEDDGDFGENSAHFLTMHATLKSSRIRPTVFVRIPTDDPVKEYLGTVLGIGATFGF